MRKTSENVAAFTASLDELDKLCDSLMDVPAVDPKLGPQKSKDNHKAWTQALREKVNAEDKR